MHKVTKLALMVFALPAVGCTSAFKSKIDTVPVKGASVEVEELGGNGPRQACQTPCSIEVTPFTRYKLTVRAPGYYPASMELQGVMILRSGSGLVVPLKQIGEATPARTP